MCGIFGALIINYNGSSDSNLYNSFNKIKHRGPDRSLIDNLWNPN